MAPRPFANFSNFSSQTPLRSLDWRHAAEHLHNNSRAAFGSKNPEAPRSAEQQIDRLWNGKTSAIIDELQKQIQAPRLSHPKVDDASPHVILHRDAFSYFRNTRKAMRYPFFRSQGWPIGSGAAKSAVKRFGLRVKGSKSSGASKAPKKCSRSAPPISTARPSLLETSTDRNVTSSVSHARRG